MPTVKDEQGNIIAKMPYDKQGEVAAEKMVEDSPNLEIDYGQNNVTDAPSMRENYQLGGLIPGNPGFGQRPIVSPPLSPIMEEGGEVDKIIVDKVKKYPKPKLAKKLFERDEMKRTIKEARKEKRSRIKKARQLKREGKFSKEFTQDMKIKARREKQDKVTEAKRYRKRALKIK